MFKPARSYPVIIASLLLLQVCLASAAQQAPPGSQVKPDQQSETQQAAKQKKEIEIKEGQTVIKEETEVVSVSVTVTDPDSRLVTGLDQQDFEILEDKVRQKIEYFNIEDAPISIGIIFDISGSMKGKIDRARAALEEFIQTSHIDDDYFLIAFNHRANLIAEFTDGETLMRKLTMVEPRGQTALYDAAYLGLDKVKQGRHQKRALLLISDGEDNSSRYSYGELRKVLKEANVQIYCIGILEGSGGAGSLFDGKGKSVLDEVAGATGGKAFFPRSGPELEDLITRIALELRHQYSIGYIPTNQQRDGKWRALKVNVTPPPGMPRVTVSAKEGYYAVPR